MNPDLSPSLPEAAWLTRGPAVIDLPEDIFQPHYAEKRFEWQGLEKRGDFVYRLNVEFMRGGLGGVKKWPREDDWKLLGYLLEASVEGHDSSKVELDGGEICEWMGWDGEDTGPRRLALGLARWANVQFVFSVSHEAEDSQAFQMGSGCFLTSYQDLWDDRFAVVISKNLTWPLKQKWQGSRGLALLDSVHTQYNDQKWSR